jgi:hypothetical protein
VCARGSFPQDAPPTASGDTDRRDLLARWRRRRLKQKSKIPIKAASASRPSTTPSAIAVVRFFLVWASAVVIAAAADDEAAAASAVLDADWEEVAVGVAVMEEEEVVGVDDLVEVDVVDELVVVAVNIDLTSV